MSSAEMLEAMHFQGTGVRLFLCPCSSQEQTGLPFSALERWS